MMATDENSVKISCPSPLDVPAFLTFACKQYQTYYTLNITVETFDDGHSRRKSERHARFGVDEDVGKQVDDSVCEKSSDSVPVTVDDDDDYNTINVILIQDVYGRLIQIYINYCRDIPPDLIKILGLCTPYHPTFNRITFRGCRLRAVCLYEVSKFLYQSKSTVTEIWLDNSPVRGRNYNVLLENPSVLRLLSLARCNLDDSDVCTIASFLAHPLPASSTLKVLNLSINKIGDKGACAIGESIRSNRTLQYLNLAANRIYNDGAISIFTSLMEFRLTCKELEDQRSEITSYMRYKMEMYIKCLTEITAKHCDATSFKKANPISRTSRLAKAASVASASANSLHHSAYLMASNIVGTYSHPFSKSEVTLRDSYTYSIGNNTLNCLNLSYNNLDYLCIPILLDVVTYQNSELIRQKAKGGGLLFVKIEGNNLPLHCAAYDGIYEILEKRLASTMKPDTKSKSEKGRRKSAQKNIDSHI